LYRLALHVVHHDTVRFIKILRLVGYHSTIIDTTNALQRDIKIKIDRNFIFINFFCILISQSNIGFHKIYVEALFERQVLKTNQLNKVFLAYLG